jgi:hypothetical protein
MKNQIVLLGVLSVLLLGCGKEKKKEVIVEAAYSPYFEQFKVLVTAVGGSVTIEDLAIVSAADLGSTRVLAVCEIPAQTGEDDDDKRPTVKIGPSWSTLNEDQRLALLSHELMHCLLGAVHDSTMFTNGNAASLMNPYLINTFEGVWQKWYMAKALGTSTASFASPEDSTSPP